MMIDMNILYMYLFFFLFLTSRMSCLSINKVVKCHKCTQVFDSSSSTCTTLIY
ncbi:hypothetical protein JHK87_013743 [Glycine soja]|nr:hypothetical protein JHK87_013743 [Glycine soja]